MRRMNASMFRQMVLLGALLALPPVVSADAGHDPKPPAKMKGMEGMDHGKPGAMDHSKMGNAKMDDHWMAPPEMAKRKNPIPADKASFVRGKQVYDASCASCHGASGKGDGPAGKALNPKPADLAAMAPQHPPGDLAWKIETGRGPMPPWKDALTQNEIWDVVNYVQSLGGAKAKSKSTAPKQAPAHDGHTGHAH